MGASESLQGYRVIEVCENSPASEAGLKSYLDFIISANGLKLAHNDTFQNIISKSRGCKVFLRVFSVLTQAMRDLVVVPREGWGGDGLMGITIRWENCIAEDVLRIVSVVPGSKAETAGLIALKEYVMGTQEETVTSIDRLAILMRKSDSIVIFVYNSNEQNVRKVCLETSGESVGFEVAQGMFHSWPDSSSNRSESPMTPDQILEPITEPQQDSSKPLENPSPVLNPFLEPQPSTPSPLEVSKSRPPPALVKPVSISRSKTFKVGSPPGFLCNDSTFHSVIFESSFISF